MSTIIFTFDQCLFSSLNSIFASQKPQSFSASVQAFSVCIYLFIIVVVLCNLIKGQSILQHVLF